MLFYVIFAVIFGISYILSNYVIIGIAQYLSHVIFTLVLLYVSWQWSQFIWRFHWIPKLVIEPANKCVLITGCDTGFGNLLAQRLSKYGFHVFAGCLFPDGDGAKKLHADNRNITIVPLDVTDDESVKNARKFVDSSIGDKTLWALINNAGILTSTEIEFGDMSPFISQMNVNCLGIVRVTKAFVPLLRKSGSGGRVVNMASLAGRFSIPGMVGYCMSKCAVISFSDGLRREMKKWSIDVVCIEPHLFKTNLVNDQNQKSALSKAWDQTPEDVRNDYGECYFNGFDSLMQKALHTARDGVNNVVDTMYLAVTHESVGPYYRVLGPYERLRVWMFEYLWPTRIIDMISYLGCVYVTGLPEKLRKSDVKKVN